MSRPRKPSGELSSQPTSEAWTTLTNVATPSHSPVIPLVSESNHGHRHHINTSHRHLNYWQSSPEFPSSGSTETDNVFVEPVPSCTGIDSLRDKRGATSSAGFEKATTHTHPSLSDKSEYLSRSKVAHSRSSPERHTHPVRHATSNQFVREVLPVEQPPPPSPGKLAQKYMEHIETGPRQYKHSMQFNSPPSHVQDRPAVSSVKATALVAPYVGDNFSTHPQSNSDLRTSQRSESEGSFEPDLRKARSSSIPHSIYMGRKPESLRLSGSRVQSGSAEKWKSLVETKDHILSQKNNLIERQKQTISHLQEQLKESESKVHHLRTSKAHDKGGGALNSRLKELEYRNAAHKAEWAELQSTKLKEVDSLSKKLDALEYELDKKTVDFSKQTKELETENKELRQQVDSQHSVLKEVEQKLIMAGSKNSELSEHIVKLNGYFENMPTMEEHHALKEHAEHCNKLCSSLTRQLSEKDTHLKLTETKLREKEDAFLKLELASTELRKQLENVSADLGPSEQRVSDLECENRKLVKECQRLQKMLFEADTHCRRELQSMRERHKDRFLEATADLRAKHKVVAKRVKLLETQLLKNSDAMMAMNGELQLSQGTIGQLKSSVKDMTALPKMEDVYIQYLCKPIQLLAQNHQLVEKNVTLQEVSSEASKVASVITEGQSAAAQQLAVELTQCIGDFDSLVNLSTSLLEGRDPSASLVLGVRDCDDYSSAIASETDLAFAGSHEEKLQQVRKLQSEINRLREIVSDQFAAQVSSACHVQ